MENRCYGSPGNNRYDLTTHPYADQITEPIIDTTGTVLMKSEEQAGGVFNFHFTVRSRHNIRR